MNHHLLHGFCVGAATILAAVAVTLGVLIAIERVEIYLARRRARQLRKWIESIKPNGPTI